MFERFTEKAVMVMTLSQLEAQRLGHEIIGTEHILIGIYSEGTSIAYKALNEATINLIKLKKEIELVTSLTTKINDKIDAEKILSLRPEAKTALELARDYSDELGDYCITPTHLLVALLHEENSLISTIFSNLNVNVPNMLNSLRKMHKIEMTEFEDIQNEFKEDVLDENSLKKISKYITNLNEPIKKNKYTKRYDRNNLLSTIFQILGRRHKKNPCLIGEPGVGKTTILNAVIGCIVNGNAPSFLDKKVFYKLNPEALIEGTRSKNEFEDRIQAIVKVFNKNKNFILVIDDIHDIIGGLEGPVDGSFVLNPALSSGNLQCIGVTTIEQYKKNIEKNGSLLRRFQPVKILEPTIDQTIQMLNGIKVYYEIFHGVEINAEAIKAAATFGQKYITDRFLPEKAIDILDETCSRMALNFVKTPKDAQEFVEKLRISKDGQLEAIEQGNFSLAEEWQEIINEISEQINHIKKKAYGKLFETPMVKAEHIAEMVTFWTGIPISNSSKLERDKLQNLEQLLHTKIIGQNTAVSAIARAIKRSQTGLKDPNRPIASFIFSGPTGVGKTELTKALAEIFFQTEKALIRFDMSEYVEKHTIAKLIGSPPGYVGYEEGGFLTEKVKNNPYSVILFDEVEKGHPDIFNVLLQILEDGRLTDSKGQIINFKESIIILTSNIGSKLIENLTRINLENQLISSNSVNDSEEYKTMAEGVIQELKDFFRPELLNRLDEIIVFQQLKQSEVRQIADIMIKQLCNRIANQGYVLKVSESVKDKVSIEGFEPLYGARPLRRAITKLLEDQISNLFITKEIPKGSIIEVDLNDFGNITIINTGLIAQLENNKNNNTDTLERIILRRTRARRKEIEANEIKEIEINKKQKKSQKNKTVAEVYREQLLKKRKEEENLKIYQEELRKKLN